MLGRSFGKVLGFNPKISNLWDGVSEKCWDFGTVFLKSAGIQSHDFCFWGRGFGLFVEVETFFVK